MSDPASYSIIRNFIAPRSVAIIGASEGTDYGGRLLRNLREGGYAGTIYPVNPRRSEVQGLQAWQDVRDLPEAPDLAAIVVPPRALYGVVEACGQHGIQACAIITAGFGERGAEGAREQQALLALARQAGVRFSGPNSLGIANITGGMFAAAASGIGWARIPTRPSGISIISQSGALSFNPIPSRAAERGIGLRAIVSLGNQGDLSVADFLEYLIEADAETKAVGLFLEGLPAGEGTRLLRIARRARELGKPILVMKVGRSPATAAVARSHTAALTGDDAVYQGVFRAAHITRVDDLDELWETGVLLAACPDFTPGGGIGFLSNSGGMNSLFADQCGINGVPLAALAPQTTEGISRVLSGFGAAGNPADITGNIARPALVDLLDLFTADPAVDLMVVGATGSASGQRSLDIATNLSTARRHTRKPFAGLWFSAMAGTTPETSGARTLIDDGLPLFAEPAKCARALAALYAWRRPLAPPPAPVTLPRELRTDAWQETQQDALRLLAACGIPTAELHATTSAEEAISIAARLGWPVVLKIEAPGLRHKTEHGGVRVGIGDAYALRRTWTALWTETDALGPDRRILLQPQLRGLELLLGSRIDPNFGPVVALGAGGTMVEIENDLAFRPAPLAAETVHDILGELRIARRFTGLRGSPPCDVAALLQAVIRFGALAAALAENGTEIEINPLMLRAEGEGVCAVDARLTLRVAK